MQAKRNPETYCTVKQIAEDPAFCFSEPMLRFYILNAKKNGLWSAIRKVGRKTILRRDLFISWLEKTTGNSNA